MLKSKRHIDFQKVLITPVLLTAMYAADAWESSTAWVYLSMHATYGLIWCAKSFFFPDKNFEKPIPWFAAILFIHVPLAVFQVPAVLFILRRQEAPMPAMAAALMMYTWGMFFHFVSDMQKHTQLKAKPGLITDGLFSLSRNINYFGELLIYGAFMALGAAALTSAWPLLWLTGYVALLWVPMMKRKDKSLARHEDFKAYSARTKMFIPFVV